MEFIGLGPGICVTAQDREFEPPFDHVSSVLVILHLSFPLPNPYPNAVISSTICTGRSAKDSWR